MKSVKWSELVRRYWGDISDEWNSNRMRAVENGWLTVEGELTEGGKKELFRTSREEKFRRGNQLFERVMAKNNKEKKNPIDAVIVESQKFGIDVRKYGKIKSLGNGKYKIEYYGAPVGGNSRRNVVLEYVGTVSELLQIIEFQKDNIFQTLKENGVFR